MLINKSEGAGIRHFNDSKAFMKYSNDMDDIYKNIEEHNPNKKRKILIVFDDMIVDRFSNKKLKAIVTEVFIKGRKLNISLVFITQPYYITKKYWIKFNILLDYENSTQKRTSINRIC